MTIDVNPAEYSYIPRPPDQTKQRTQRSAQYGTDSAQNGNQQYGSNPENNSSKTVYGMEDIVSNTPREAEATTATGNEQYNHANENAFSSYPTSRPPENSGLTTDTLGYSTYDHSPQNNESVPSSNASMPSASSYQPESYLQYGASSDYVSNPYRSWESNETSLAAQGGYYSKQQNATYPTGGTAQNATYPYPSWQNNNSWANAQAGYNPDQQNATQFPVNNESTSGANAANATYPYLSGTAQGLRNGSSAIDLVENATSPYSSSDSSNRTPGGNQGGYYPGQDVWNDGSNDVLPNENATYPYPSWDNNQTSVTTQGGYYPEQQNATQYSLGNESGIAGSSAWPSGQKYYNNSGITLNAQNQSNTSYPANLLPEYSLNTTNITERAQALSNSSNTPQNADLQSAGYTYSEQALGPAQTPYPAPASAPAPEPYPAYAPYPAPYFAPYPAPYPAPSYTPYPAPSTAYAPYPAPSTAYGPYPYSALSPYAPYAPYPSPSPAPKDNETSK